MNNTHKKSTSSLFVNPESYGLGSIDKFDEYQFTANWFECNIPQWMRIFQAIKPQRILEIGSFEGMSTCFLINTLTKHYECQIHCVDSWQGGQEHTDLNMNDIEARFTHNIKKSCEAVKHNVNVHVHKGLTQEQLPKLLAAGGKNFFDFIYIDGSHEAPDVLFDAVLSFQLLRKGGIIAFDDYLWPN